MPLTAERLAQRIPVAFALTFALGLLVFAGVRFRPVADFDLAATTDTHRFALDHDGVATAARAITWVGHPLTLTGLVVVAAIAFFVSQRVELAVWLITVTAFGAITETLLKVTIQRSRPDLDTALLQARGTSFPSGHAMNTAIVIGAIVLTLRIANQQRRWIRHLQAGAIGLCLVVAFSRPLLGVHYLSDIAGGLVLALVWLLAMSSFYDGR